MFVQLFGLLGRLSALYPRSPSSRRRLSLRPLYRERKQPTV